MDFLYYKCFFVIEYSIIIKQFVSMNKTVILIAIMLVMGSTFSINHLRGGQ